MKRKAGFTLIELVVAIVMACILLASLTPLLTLAQNGTYTAQRSTRAAQAGDAISEYIMNLLKNAERVYIGDDGAHKPGDWEQWNRISVSESGKDGLLTVNDAAVYPLEYQEGCALTLRALGESRDQLTLGVALGDNRSSDTLYSKQSSVRLAGLEQNGFGQLEGLTGAWMWADGFPRELQTIGAVSGVSSLVIYFKGGGSPLPEFTPGAGGAPADPTPGPSAFSVTLPARMEVKEGDQAPLRGYVTWPQGLTDAQKEQAVMNASWQMISPSGAAEYLTVTGIATAVPTLEAQLFGIKATDKTDPVTVKVTLSVIVDGKTLTASATSLINVWKDQAANMQLRYMSPTDGQWHNVVANKLCLPLGSKIMLMPNTSSGGATLGDWTSSNQTIFPNFNDRQEVTYTPSVAGFTSVAFKGTDSSYGWVNIFIFSEDMFEWKLLAADGAADTAVDTTGMNAVTRFTFPGDEPLFAELTLTLPEGVPDDMFTGYRVQPSVASNRDNDPWPSWSNLPFIRPDSQPLTLAGRDHKIQCTFALPFAAAYTNTTYLNDLSVRMTDNYGLVSADESYFNGRRLSVKVLPQLPFIITTSSSSSAPDISGNTITMYAGETISLFAFNRASGSAQGGTWHLSYPSTIPNGQQPTDSGQYNPPYQITARPSAKSGDTYTVTFSDWNNNKATVTIQIA